MVTVKLPDLQGKPLNKVMVTKPVPAGGDIVTRIKATYSLFKYISQFTELKPSDETGRYWMGNCPFHDDENPSFWVDGQMQVWKCLSPYCEGHRGGDIINFYMLKHHLTLTVAIRALAVGVRS